ncbi:MAG: WG repeat-containing protein [Ruminiclostridium sp.]
MSKLCPSCKREIQSSEQFCPFCAAFAGEKEDKNKKSRLKAIIGCAAGVAVLGTVAALVFAFDVFGLFGEKVEEALPGTGDKLFNMSLSPAKSGDKWGYIDESGEFVIKPQFTAAYPFDDKTNGTAAVSSENGFGYIDEKGAYTVSPQFSFAQDFAQNGLSAVTDSDGKMQFVDAKGRAAFGGKRFTYAKNFEENSVYTYAYCELTITAAADDGHIYNVPCNEYYLLSNDGNTVITIDSGISIEQVFGDKFTGSMRETDINKDSNEFSKKTYAVYNSESQKLTEYYDRIFVTNEYVLLCRTDNEYGIFSVTVCDKELNVKADGYYCDRDPDFASYGLVLMKKDNGRMRKVLLDSKLSEVYTETDGTAVISGFDNSKTACVYDNGKYCGYNENGRLFQCDYPFTSFNCGLAPFYSKGKIGYINTEGKIVIEAQYDGASEFYADGYAYVFKGGAYSVIDMAGKDIASQLGFAPTKLIHNGTCHKWYIPTDFDSAEYFVNAVNFGYVPLCTAADTSLTGYGALPVLYDIDSKEELKEGAQVVLNYGSFEDGYALLYKNGYFIADSAGNVMPIPSDSSHSMYVMKCGSEYFFASAQSDDRTLVFKDVNDIGFTVKSEQVITSTEDGLIITKSNELFDTSSQKMKNIYKLYKDDMQSTLDILSDGNLYINCASKDSVLIRYSNHKSVDPINVDMIIDINNGEVLFSADGNGNITLWDNGFFCVETYTDNNSCYYSPTGKRIGSFLKAWAYDDKLLCYKSAGEYELYDRYGALLGKYEYACMSPDSQYIVISRDGKYVCLDRRMHEVFSSELSFTPPVNGYAAYADTSSGKIGYLDMNGDIAIPAFAKYAMDFSSDGYVRVTEESDYSVLFSGMAEETLYDTSGNKVISVKELSFYNNTFPYKTEYYKTMHSFANGYQYFINKCRNTPDMTLDTTQDKIEAAGIVPYTFYLDAVGNTPQQFLELRSDYRAQLEDIILLDDKTPALAVYVPMLHSISDDGESEIITESKYLLCGLDGKIIKEEEVEEEVIIWE